MRIGALTHPEDRALLMKSFEELISGQQNFASIEHRVQNRAGEWRRFRTNATPLFDPQGKIIGVVASLRDITELKRLEEQLIQSEKLAAMGQMIAGVAHELNNPLTAILGVTEMVREHASDEGVKKQLDLAHRQARRAAQIVQNLLDFSRPPAPEKKLVQINDLLERTLQLHDHSLRRNHISVEFTSHPELPRILGDANQLIQVLLNLVTNAEHAIREVRESGKVQIQLTHDGKHITLRVQDDGAGIRKEALPKLFDPFYTTKRPGGGTGLGLSICMSIIREHGGQIEVERIPDGGSAFSIIFPVAPDQSMDKVSSQASLKGSEAVRDREPGSLKGRAVLVVDDEESILELVKSGLEAQGLKIDCAVNAVQAISLAAHNSYDAVLCDVNLSGSGQTLSGEQLYERLGAGRDSVRPPFIFMTGELVEPPASISSGESLRRVQKPFCISDILAVLKEVLESSPAETLKK
jgi:two-component system NtrC family sensor kinase